MSEQSAKKFAHQALQQLGTAPAPKVLEQTMENAIAVHHHFYGSTQEQALTALKGEVDELLEAIEENHSKAHIRNEVGDVVFSLIAICRCQNIDFQTCVDKVAERWINRAAVLEEKVFNAGYNWENAPRPERDQFWKEAKQELKSEEYKD